MPLALRHLDCHWSMPMHILCHQEVDLATQRGVPGPLAVGASLPRSGGDHDAAPLDQLLPDVPYVAFSGAEVDPCRVAHHDRGTQLESTEKLDVRLNGGDSK